MMGWLSVALGILAAFTLHQTEARALFWLAVAATIAALWSWGVMHNHAMEAAKSRTSFHGGFYDVTEEEADAVPNWLALVNLLATIGCGSLLAVGIYRLI